MALRERDELAELIKRADDQRRKITALQNELERLDQMIARARTTAISATGRPERRRVPRKK